MQINIRNERHHPSASGPPDEHPQPHEKSVQRWLPRGVLQWGFGGNLNALCHNAMRLIPISWGSPVNSSSVFPLLRLVFFFGAETLFSMWCTVKKADYPNQDRNKERELKTRWQSNTTITWGFGPALTDCASKSTFPFAPSLPSTIKLGCVSSDIPAFHI